MAASSDDRKWYCVRTQPKHEQIAAAHLRRELMLDVFSPKLRIRRATKRGAVWFVEALFPGYIFARFCWMTESQMVRGTRGVSTLVTFGENVPEIAETLVQFLRTQFDTDECHEVPEEIKDGDLITIGGGPFHGLQATVLRVMSPSRRIQVLLEIMGGTKPVEIPMDQVAREDTSGTGLAKRTPFFKQGDSSNRGCP
jgi:transcriptional antiterminator RfaH